MISVSALTGRSREHVITLPQIACTLQAKAAEAFMAMRADATKDGIDLAVASSWRDFLRQRRIWNAKCQLQKPLLDTSGQRMDGRSLDLQARIEAILRWSAMPGASRHHWGTDLDVFDQTALGSAELQLVPAEYAPGGPCARLHAWLQRHMHEFGFYQPYRTDRGGVSPEPWHLSYAPLAVACERQLDCDQLLSLLRETEHDPELRLEGHDLLLKNLPVWYSRFMAAVDAPPSSLTEPG